MIITGLNAVVSVGQTQRRSFEPKPEGDAVLREIRRRFGFVFILQCNIRRLRRRLRGSFECCSRPNVATKDFGIVRASQPVELCVDRVDV